MIQAAKDLQARLDQARDDEARLTSEIADAVAAGRPAGPLVASRDEARAAIEALPALVAAAAEREAAAFRLFDAERRARQFDAAVAKLDGAAEAAAAVDEAAADLAAAWSALAGLVADVHSEADSALGRDARGEPVLADNTLSLAAAARAVLGAICGLPGVSAPDAPPSAVAAVAPLSARLRTYEKRLPSGDPAEAVERPDWVPERAAFDGSHWRLPSGSVVSDPGAPDGTQATRQAIRSAEAAREHYRTHDSDGDKLPAGFWRDPHGLVRDRDGVIAAIELETEDAA